ncbi:MULTISPECIES: MarR family winged helix-turn-helix transcriptional regulator [Bacillaceae]|uniref:MarR family transcriptional regulator n=1 Tax=Evansella alkalicola TaxID=745819 RepID=A0ABS6JZ85_9BACI|nr:MULTISPECIES: MarR family transcriptional regulator [Bacillaceae]MBU9722400.1 MarR family transcriptional regulator [Bacillus alkalicola]
MDSPKELFAKGYYIYALFRGLHLSIENDIKKSLCKYNISFPCFRVLWNLYFDPNITMSKISVHLQTDISNVFRQLRKLEELGMVTLKSGKDARTKDICLTDKGRSLVSNYIDDHASENHFQFTKILEEIDPEDLNKLTHITTKLGASLTGEYYTEWVSKSALNIENEKLV